MLETKEAQDVERHRELKLQRQEHEYLSNKNSEFKQENHIALLKIKRMSERVKKQKEKLAAALERKQAVHIKALGSRVIQSDFALMARRVKQVFSTKSIREVISKLEPVQIRRQSATRQMHEVMAELASKTDLLANLKVKLEEAKRQKLEADSKIALGVVVEKYSESGSLVAQIEQLERLNCKRVRFRFIVEKPAHGHIGDNFASTEQFKGVDVSGQSEI